MRLTAEQVELQDLVRRFLAEKVTSEYRRNRISNNVRFDANFWSQISELGLADTFSGSHPSCGLIELALIAQECGRALVPESLVEHVLTASFCESVLGREGQELFAGAISPRTGACGLAFSSCSNFTSCTKPTAVTGVARWAVGGDDATGFFGFTATEEGRRLFFCPLPQAPGVKTQVPSLDLTTPLNEINLADVPAQVFSTEATAAFETALEVLKASEVSGICRKVLEMTVEYVKTRQQFGVPIGSFQAIQHKLAQAYADAEALSSLCLFAAWSFRSSPDQGRLTSQAAILKAAELGTAICETAIQCHGGIGFTWDFDLHLYLRRAKSIEAAFSMTHERAKSLLDSVV